MHRRGMRELMVNLNSASLNSMNNYQWINRRTVTRKNRKHYPALCKRYACNLIIGIIMISIIQLLIKVIINSFQQ